MELAPRNSVGIWVASGEGRLLSLAGQPKGTLVYSCMYSKTQG